MIFKNRLDRPYTTLFMLMSVDGKISTGAEDRFDFDTDIPKLSHISKGLSQYYELEQKTDLYSLNTGRVMEKIGVNEKSFKKSKSPVSFIIIDNEPHLTKTGVINLSNWVKQLIIVTNHKSHPATGVDADNIDILQYSKAINFHNMFQKLKSYTDRITVQCGSTMNSVFIRNGFIDELNIVVAPLLVGGVDTPSLIGGKSISALKELNNSQLRLIEVQNLNDSFINLKYTVIKNT